MRKYEYYKPDTLERAWEFKLTKSESMFVAGATDVFVKIKNGVIKPSALISLLGIESLRGVSITDDESGIEIGGTTTIREIQSSPAITSKYPVLSEAISKLGSVQVRNIATIGGNLCNASPCADTAPPLIVLGAKLKLESPSGKREMPVEEFFKGPGETSATSQEILTKIFLPPPVLNAKFAFYKKGRVKMDLAIASLAVLMELDGDICKTIKIAAGSVAPVPLRLKNVEKFIEGKKITQDVIEHAGVMASKEVAPITDIRAGEQYRRKLIETFLKRFLMESIEKKEKEAN